MEVGSVFSEMKLLGFRHVQNITEMVSTRGKSCSFSPQNLSYKTFLQILQNLDSKIPALITETWIVNLIFLDFSVVNPL